jgi:hypothetical protein
MSNPFAPSGSAVKLDVGETIVMMVSEFKMLDNQYEPGTKVPIIAGRTKEGDDVTLWCSKKMLLSAIGAAMRDAGHDGTPETNAILTVTRIEDGVAKPGQSAPHLFEAKYQRPSGDAPAAAAVPEPEPVKEADPADFFAA